MTYRIENEVIDEDRVTFDVTCRYPDGKRVLCAAMLDLRDGKIVKEVAVEAWDE